ncbi:MAG: nicotinate (nicotinamide) nucleotide adenylyltransferase, partial [Gemmatimonadaceae bacterium]
YFIPASQQPLKQGRHHAEAADRLAMVRLMAEGDDRFEVEAIEIERAGLSYSVDTLEAFAARAPGDERYFLIGADVVHTFSQWRSPKRVAELACLTVLRRDSSEMPVEKAALVGSLRAITGDSLPAPIVLDSRQVDVSSTEIRERVRTRRSLHGFVPDAVARFITERGLYR